MEWQTRRRMVDLSEGAVVMGILNATPDSFSDGGDYVGEEAVRCGLRLEEEGAGIVDVGGESTRPGAVVVSVEEELRRVIPVVAGLRAVSDVLISVDTSKSEVAREALAAGGDIVNDVTGCMGDSAMAGVCAEAGAGVVVMHMQGSPRTMQVSPRYEDVVGEVEEFFEERYDYLLSEGVRGDGICFDPGIGFGKGLEHNMRLLSGVGGISVHGRPVLLGVSRKSVIGDVLGVEDARRRDAGTVGLTVQARLAGCMLHRVHAVRECVDALRMVEEVMRYG